MLFYHGSPIKGIEKFIPRKSTHGIPAIYAVKNINSAFLYCAKWNDFMITLGSDNVIVERCIGAFDELYKDKKGYIYVLDGRTFRYSELCNDYISTVPVNIIDCLEIKNLYDTIMSEYNVYFYPNKPSWIPVDDSDIVIHAEKLYKMCGDAGIFEYVKIKFPHLKAHMDNIKF